MWGTRLILLTVQRMPTDNIKIAVKGKWVSVPALNVGGKHIVVRGNWLRVAYVNNEQWLETEVEDPALCVKMLKAEGGDGLCADLFTFSQKLPATEPKYPYAFEWDSIAAARANSFKDWWDGLPQETRKNVRRSEKRGVVVEVKKLDSALVQDLFELNNESSLRQGKAFTHYGKTLEQVARDQVDYLDRSDYICTYFGKELIGVLKLVYRGDVASILTFLPTYGMYNYGNKQHTPLREFKIRNGFGEALVPRFYIPLTAKGAVSLRLRLHRGFLGILPHNVITLLVRLRTEVNNFTLSRCSSTSERPNRIRQMERSIPPAGSKL